MKKAAWQLTEKEIETLEPLKEIKRLYAKRILRLIKSIPRKYHQVAYFDSMDVGFEVTSILTQDLMKINYEEAVRKIQESKKDENHNTS